MLCSLMHIGSLLGYVKQTHVIIDEHRMQFDVLRCHSLIKPEQHRCSLPSYFKSCLLGIYARMWLGIECSLLFEVQAFASSVVLCRKAS